MPKLAVGVMGSSESPFADDAYAKLVELGRAVAQQGCVLITGACPGLPYAAVQGAAQDKGLVVGISPGLSLWEHETKYGSPSEGFDVLIYTGSGLMGREVETIRSSDIVVIAGGRSGTLGEFAIAYDEGRLIGVLTGTGGIADGTADLVRMCQKDTGAVVLYDDDPSRLIDRLVDYYRTTQQRRPSCFGGPLGPPAGL
jgi:uncharacterized protein (TIGR00725 family)